jgi:hypothetical protein
MLLLMLDEARMVTKDAPLNKETCEFVLAFVLNCMSEAEFKHAFKRPEVKQSGGEFKASSVFGGKDVDYNF